MMGVEGRVALVTGGTSGIGLAIATALGRAGAIVVVNSENEAACHSVAEQLRTSGAIAHACAADMGDPRSVDDLGASAARLAGPVDLLFCNAGVPGPVGAMHEAAESDIARTFAINLDAPRRLCAAIAPTMATRGRGAIVLIASLAGLRGNKALGIYGLTKAALAQLARNLAVEWGPHGVRANAVSPGLIATGWEKPILADPEAADRRLRQTPLRRIGRPAEVASAALFLASDAASFVTGHNLVVDGGTIISDGN